MPSLTLKLYHKHMHIYLKYSFHLVIKMQILNKYATSEQKFNVFKHVSTISTFSRNILSLKSNSILF